MPQNPCEAPPRRRWFRFSLRTMLIAVVVLSIPLAWVAYSLNWIRERRKLIGNSDSNPFVSLVSPPGSTQAPQVLWLLGEGGRAWIRMPISECERARKLFPEAEIHEYVPEDVRLLIRPPATQD
jgi:hypothetical protein